MTIIRRGSSRFWAVLVLALLAPALLVAAPRVGFLTNAPSSEDPLAIALAYLSGTSENFGLALGDLAGLQVTDRYVSRHTGVTHIYLRQSHAGIPVANGVANVNVMPDGRVLNMGQRLVAGLAAAVNATSPVLTPEEAIFAAADHLGLVPGAALEQVPGPSVALRFSGAGISQEEIPVELAYLARHGQVRLTWQLSLRLFDDLHWWVLWVDAVTGQVLDQANLIANDTYEVFALPKENPNDGGRTVEVDPAESVASPFAWHDTNGAPGAEFTDTRGNNVFAQEDRDANNAGGFRPDGGAGLDFQFPLDLNKPPVDYQSAAVANLFYWNNIIHDVWYQYGFDEAAGNFQENNYGRGGVGSDPVQADAQDGSGTNNANFSTPPDGADPRMQMFEWLYPFPNLLEVLSGPASGTYIASGAGFGPAFTEAGVSGSIVLAQDGSGADVNDGCEPLTNGGEVAGNIAMINRGSCTFVTKVRNAQNVGATAVAIVNNTDGSPITMGDDGTGGDIVIPSGMIAKADGDLIKPTLPADGRMRNGGGDVPPSRDSDLDNGIIAHEYGHGVSNRLTGGPAQTGCLRNQEQMGEGWSDWHALVLTAAAGDTGEQRRGVGTYVIFEEPDGTGIRHYPYSTDMTINPHTYADIATEPVPHGVGSVWAAMIWEVYWNLVDRYGFDADFYHGHGGNNLAMQLVMDGLKLQPCSPDFVDGRDAILAADLALTGGANQCLIWEGFAKRGLGVSADAGSPDSVTDGTEAFDVPEECNCALNVGLDRAEYLPGQTIEVDIFLQHNRLKTVKVPFFLWVENEQGERVTGIHSRPHVLHTGDQVRQHASFPLPKDLAPGRYRLSVGVGQMRQGTEQSSRPFTVAGPGGGPGSGARSTGGGAAVQ